VFTARATTVLFVIIAVTSSLFLAGCGESKEEKALATVCNSRATIKKNVDELTAITPATFTLDGVKGNLSAIQDSLKSIKAAQPDLGPTPKQQIQTANQTFGDAVTSSVKQLGTSLSVTGIQKNVTTAAQNLASAYQQAFEPVDCSSVSS
jgi:hypothetical protein